MSKHIVSVVSMLLGLIPLSAAAQPPWVAATPTPNLNTSLQPVGGDVKLSGACGGPLSSCLPTVETPVVKLQKPVVVKPVKPKPKPKVNRQW